MKTHKLWYLLVSCLGLGFAANPEIVSASGYTNGNTELAFEEMRRETLPLKFNSKPITGYFGNYGTTIGDEQWSGRFVMTSRFTNTNYTTFSGKFEDGRIQNVPSQLRQTCEGNITIRRTNPAKANPITAQVVWQIKGGKNCPSVGKEVKLTLVEALPKPNPQGDFMDPYTLPPVGNGGGLWRKWRVVSTDGTLNCRETANGKILKTYRAGEEFDFGQRDPGSGRGVFMIKGVPWFRIRFRDTQPIGCFVRANSRYIAPVSMPF